MRKPVHILLCSLLAALLLTGCTPKENTITGTRPSAIMGGAEKYFPGDLPGGGATDGWGDIFDDPGLSGLFNDGPDQLGQLQYTAPAGWIGMQDTNNHFFFPDGYSGTAVFSIGYVAEEEIPHSEFSEQFEFFALIMDQLLVGFALEEEGLTALAVDGREGLRIQEQDGSEWLDMFFLIDEGDMYYGMIVLYDGDEDIPLAVADMDGIVNSLTFTE